MAAALSGQLRLNSVDLASPNARSVNVTARLRAPIRVARVQTVLDTMVSPSSTPPIHGPLRFRVSPWLPETNANHRLILWLAMGMVSGLLLIGCANLASILLARAIGRRRDYAIRLATGASRMQVIRQSLFEVCLLAFAALLIATVGSSAALHLIREHTLMTTAGIPNLARIQLNTETLLFSFGVACFAALMCSLFPAVSATSIDLSTALRETGTQVTGGRSARRFLHSVLAVEAGISMILLLTSGLLIRSLVRLMSDDHGLKPDHVLTLRMPTGSWQKPSRQPTEEERLRQIQQYVELMHRAEQIHGVRAAALASSLPLSNAVVRTRLYTPNHGASAESSQIMPISQAVTRDYFRAMGIPLLSGRAFEARDSASKSYVAVVNEAFVHAYFRDINPIGQFVHQPESKEGTQIIGVVKNSPHLDFDERVEPEIFFDFEQTLMTPFLTGLIVRTHDDPQLLANELRTALSLKDADQALVHVETLRDLIDQNTWQPRFSAWLFSAFAGIALCLSGIGIYGVVAYITTSRRRDFGIHVALGAAPAELFRLAIMRSLAPVMIGLGIGALGSYWTSRWMASLLYKTRPLDAGAMFASAAILLFMTFAATMGPALRAARVDRRSFCETSSEVRDSANYSIDCFWLEGGTRPLIRRYVIMLP